MIRFHRVQKNLETKTENVLDSILNLEFGKGLFVTLRSFEIAKVMKLC